MTDEALIARLDMMLAVLQLAHQDAIARASEQVRADGVNTAILDACAEDWVPSGTLISNVMRAASAKERTVRRHLARLLAQRAILRRGPTNGGEYRSTGLI